MKNEKLKIMGKMKNVRIMGFMGQKNQRVRYLSILNSSFFIFNY